MKRRYLFFCILFLWNLLSNAQIIAPDTVCTDEIFSIEYSGVPANSFCLIPNVNSFSQDISIDVVGEFPEGSFPLFSHTVVDGENHYVFTTLSAHGDLVRSDFGNSFSNTPTQTVFTLDEIPSGQEGIQVINDNGHWWGFIIGGNIDFFGPEYLVRLDFGSSLTNTPIVENLGNIGNLYFHMTLLL